MADQNPNPGAITNTFNRGMVKDYNETFIGEGLWTHARNMVNNSHDGQTQVSGNEPANLNCVTLPYDLIGCIHIYDGQWAVFTTDDINSEIGVFDEIKCSYIKVVNDPGLNFKRSNLITGVSRRRYDCKRPVYWADGLNPDRYMDLDNPPFQYTVTLDNGCQIKNYTSQLDLEKIRMASIISYPCVKITKGSVAGTLPNGSYQVCVAYTINRVRITDYIALSDIQPLFSHENTSGSLQIEISNTDREFDEIELVMMANINSQTVAKRIGYYSTAQGTIYIDRFDNEYETVSLTDIVLRTEPIEKSDAIYSVNNYLLKVGPYSKFKFNYQPLANNIKAKWVAVQYPADYYFKGGNHAGYLRDEQYPFFIRWIYNTGERSESYHIPGRAINPGVDDTLVFGGDAFETAGSNPVSRYRWQVENTATVDSLNTYTLSDGGIVIATGEMGYWESTEKYPDDKPSIWGNLCGKAIRHHKMPDETVHASLNSFSNNGQNIIVLGVQFENIVHPVDNEGNPIQSIIGYEILRGSREGNKTILAKGLFNNMREYDIPGNTSVKGLFQNYPYNDIRPDSYLTGQLQNGENGQVNVSTTKMSAYRKDIFSFHSPDVSFSNPYLNAYEARFYKEFNGIANGQFETPYKHPKFKVLTNFDTIIGDIVGVLSALNLFTNGIEVGATADYPIGLKIGPLPPLPFNSNFIVGGLVNGGSTPGAQGYNTAVTILQGVKFLASLTSIIATMKKFSELEKEKFLSLMRTLIPKIQYAAQYNSHGFYNQAKDTKIGNRRREIVNSSYVSDAIQQFNADYQINNLNRSKMVVVELNKEVDDPTTQDTSRFTIGEANVATYTNISSSISSYYGALKLNVPGQYGQLDSIKQISISSGCIFPTIADTTTKQKTDVLFGGDIYINRFTEKNSMFFFTDWLIADPDETEYNYSLYNNIPFPRFWINNVEYKGTLLKEASKWRALDARQSAVTYVNKGYFYLFNSGVRDFFCESEVNLAGRDWEDDLSRRHYDPYKYTDISTMFRSDIIKSGNFYKYDYSLSATKLFNSHITWGNILPYDYDPVTAEKCYVYHNNRVTYSLPQQDDSKKDNWRVFLANNYKDFPTPVTSIKSINKTGALFMMRFKSPLSFMGIEELQLDSTGAKITVGDNALFNDQGGAAQQLQSVVNADDSYEYGSCQGRFVTISTPHGVFWASQNQGKVFQFSGQVRDITTNGMKWWFSRYLPSELLKVYPDYPLYDNPVKGIGLQMIYDNTNEIIYLTKKDFKPKRSDLLYDDKGFYYIDGYTTITIPGTSSIQCPPGYNLINGQCIKTEYTAPIKTTTNIQTTRTPYSVYGIYGTKVYDQPAIGGSFTLLNTSNSFWIASTSAPDTQDGQLNNGPVNRLAVWGVLNNTIINNYTGGDVPPVYGSSVCPDPECFIGFDTCINIPTSKTYYVAIAADNNYRIKVDGKTILEDLGGTTETFNYLHIYPIQLSAGSHILSLLGRNNGNKACLAAEIYDLDNRPSGVSIIDFLNSQTDYSNLNVIFTTRNVSAFSSVIYTCPADYDSNLDIQNCTAPECVKTLIETPVTTVIPNQVIQVPKKVYCDFNSDCWEDASWTISYDPKANQGYGAWMSFHDWHPTWVIPGKNHFMSVLGSGIWKHNLRCDLFCNFYGIDYPFEIEYVISTGQQVTTVRNIEYLLEAYKFYNNCADKRHVLDENFDQAIVYNSEQVSGLLELSIQDRKNPFAQLSYPQVTPSSIKINFSKEEQKYRFNQFWDITKDRGEYTNVDIPMFNTAANGYVSEINPKYVDYNKDSLQRKKFRHNVNRVFFRKLYSGDIKLLFKISNEKILPSPR